MPEGLPGSDLLQQLLQLLGGMTQGAGSQYNSFIRNPTASPLYQNQLSGLLAALAPGEAQQRQNLGDMFRKAGNMSSGQYGTAAGNLISSQGLNRNTMASQLLGSMFPQMATALLAPEKLSEGLLQALMQNQGQGGAGGASRGGGGGGGGMDINSLVSLLGKLMGQPNPNPYQAGSGSPTGNPSLGLPPPNPVNDAGYSYKPGGTTSYFGGGPGGALTFGNPFAELEATNYGYYNPGQDPFAGQTADLSGMGWEG